MAEADDVNLLRGRRRQELYEYGFIVDLVNFHTLWNEEQVRSAVEQAFGEKINLEMPLPIQGTCGNPAVQLIIIMSCRFEVLKAVNGKLLKPNVDPRSEWTGDKLKQIAGNGDVYIKRTYKLDDEEEALLVSLHVAYTGILIIPPVGLK